MYYKGYGEYYNITQHQIRALRKKYNLADAHTHQSPSKSQGKIIARLDKLWYESQKSLQYDMEQKFIKNFFHVQRQFYALKPNNTMLLYAASIGIVIAANYLTERNMSVTLLEPCFDNLYHILKHMKIKIRPISEEEFHDPDKIYENLKKKVKTDALFLVDPNNPTGFSLCRLGGDRGYNEVIRFCKDYNKLLIIDFCFAPFSHQDDLTHHQSDTYELLEKSGVSYITYEDTGKTWPLQDTKVAMLKASKDIWKEIYHVHTDYLLNVSPFILNLVTHFILDSKKDNFASVFNLLDRNREFAKKELNGSLLEFIEPSAKVSVAWFKIKDPLLKATDLQKEILHDGVYILPGTYFYWNNPKKGERYIRIALARDPSMFKPAIKLVRKAIDRYKKRFTKKNSI